MRALISILIITSAWISEDPVFPMGDLLLLKEAKPGSVDTLRIHNELRRQNSMLTGLRRVLYLDPEEKPHSEAERSFQQ